MAYTDTTKISNYLQRSLSAYETTFLSTLIPAIKKWIDLYTSSTFDQVAATTRYYNGSETFIDIEPCTDIEEVWALNDDLTQSYEYTENTEYIAEPLNQNVKRWINKRDGCFPKGIARLSVKAKFSEYDGAVPEDIETLATIIAAGVINQGKNASSGGNVASESLEGHSITYDTSDNALEGIALDNPSSKAILLMRKQLLLGE